MDPVEVEITSLGNNTEGIGILPSGKKIFVDSPVIPGEICLVEVTEDKKNFSRGKCVELIKESPFRIIPFGQEVPGANLAHMNYEMQLKVKSDKVRDCLTRIGKYDLNSSSFLKEIVPSERTEHYRNHMQYSLRDFRFCLKSQGTNDDVPVDDSPLEYVMFSSVRKTITASFADYPTRLFDGVVLRGSERTGEVLIEFVSFADMASEIIIRDASDFVKSADLIGRLTGINVTGIMLRISNTATEKRTRGGKRVCLYGRDYYNEELCGKLFRVKSGAFFQVNVPQAEVLYQLATPSSYSGALWDLYCGTGTVGLTVIDGKHKLMGVDISPEAIASARENAVSFGIDAEFICRPASKINALLASVSRDDAVIVDPPRAGLEYSLIRSLLETGPSVISYISCDPATLSRDLKLFTDSKIYQINSVTPVDMFPGTGHVETVCLLSNRKPDARVKIDVDLEDYYRIKDEQKKNKASE